MITGKTKKGFEFNIEEKNLDNIWLIYALSECDKGNMFAVIDVLRLLLGTDQMKRMFKELGTDPQNTPVSEVEEAVAEIFELLGEEGKNS